MLSGMTDKHKTPFVIARKEVVRVITLEEDLQCCRRAHCKQTGKQMSIKGQKMMTLLFFKVCPHHMVYLTIYDRFYLSHFFIVPLCCTHKMLGKLTTGMF